MHIPYTYLIGWTALNKFYYGVRYAKNCTPSDLWSTYFTSSAHVDAFVEIHGEPDIISIRRTFKNKNSAILWENRVLRRLKVTQSDAWINRTDNRAISYVRTPEHIAAFKLRVEKARADGKLFGKGSKHTDASNQINREKHLGKKTGRTSESFTTEWKEKISTALKGNVRPQSDAERTERRHKAKTSTFNKICAGRIWITDGTNSIRIYPEQLQNYPGYIRGRFKQHTS